MKIPVGLTEKETVDIIYQACREVATQYRFGYLSAEDMVQEGVLTCIDEGLNKFKPRPDKDLKKQLLNFMRVHCRNRISNYLRKHSFRYANPDSKNNTAKYNIMHPLKIHSQGLTNSEIFSRDNTIDSDVDSKEVMDKIRNNLPTPLLREYFKWQAGVKISSTRKKILFNKILEILGDGYY